MKNWQPAQGRGERSEGGGKLERGTNGRKLFTQQVDALLAS